MNRFGEPFASSAKAVVHNLPSCLLWAVYNNYVKLREVLLEVLRKASCLCKLFVYVTAIDKFANNHIHKVQCKGCEWHWWRSQMICKLEWWWRAYELRVAGDMTFCQIWMYMYKCAKNVHTSEAVFVQVFMWVCVHCTNIKTMKTMKSNPESFGRLLAPTNTTCT